MIAIGAMAERARLGPTLIFVFVWSTLVYGTYYHAAILPVSPSLMASPVTILSILPFLIRLLLQHGM